MDDEVICGLSMELFDRSLANKLHSRRTAKDFTTAIEKNRRVKDVVLGAADCLQRIHTAAAPELHGRGIRH